MGELPQFTKEEQVMFGLKLINLIRKRSTIASPKPKKALEERISKAREEMTATLKENGYL
ncbi:MAG: hypothetical protein PHE43_01585 [Candidatus Nanoarchaeia archaeon]|nr:hypothetical protein [Candidatus Nanoarchaeia archaeon]